MRLKLLTHAALATALIASGCAKKKPKEVPAPPVATGDAAGGSGTSDGTSGTGADGTVGGANLPGSRADFIARTGSDTIYFNTDKYELDDANRATLDAQAAWLAANAGIRVTIEGHADERGTREYNLALGDRRANAARNHLTAKGVSADRMTVISWGKERPAATGSDEQAWAQNRRSVTVIPQ